MSALEAALAAMPARAATLVARLQAEDTAMRAASGRIGRQIERLEYRWGKCLPAGYRSPAEGKARFEED